MTDKRFKRYLFDGGFSFDDEYIPPRWSILDEKNNKSPFGFLEFEDEHKDLCDEIVDSLNEFVDEYNHLKEENEQLQIEKDTCKKQHAYELTKKLEYKSKLIDSQKENNHIKHVIKESYLNERTMLAKSALKQLMERIGIE